MKRFVFLLVICVMLPFGCSGSGPGKRYARYLSRTRRVLEKYESEPEKIVERLTAINKKASRIKKSLLTLDASDAMNAFSNMEEALRELNFFLDTRREWSKTIAGLLNSLIP